MMCVLWVSLHLLTGPILIFLVLAFISNQVDILAFGIPPSMTFSNCGLKDHGHFKGVHSYLRKRKKRHSFFWKLSQPEVKIIRISLVV